MTYYFYCIENNKEAGKTKAHRAFKQFVTMTTDLRLSLTMLIFEFHITLICPSARFTKILHLLFLEGNEIQKAKLKA